MFKRNGPQSAVDNERERSVSHASFYESRYAREGRSVTLFKESYNDIDKPEKFIPGGTDVRIPKHAVWDGTTTALTDTEYAEMLADLKAGYAVMEERLTLVEDEDIMKILYEAEPQIRWKT